MCVMPVLHEVWGFSRVGMRLALRAMRKSCAVAHVWQELSAVSFELGDHPGGYQYLQFWLHALICGDLLGVVAETAAGWPVAIDRVARRLHDAKKLRLRPGSVHAVCRVWL